MNTKLLSTLFVAFLTVAMFTQCGEAKKGAENVADKTGEMVDDATDKAGEMVDKAGEKAGEMVDEAKKTTEGLTEMDSKEGSLSFEQGSWAYSVLQGINAGNTTTFTLDQVPYEGEELSEAGAQQLDQLAEILKANPNWKAEIQGHTAEGVTGNGGIRAKWVQTKLVLGRGVKNKQLSSKGYGSEKTLSGLEPTDEKNKRITIELTKDEE